VNTGRREPGARKLRGQRHREAAGVRRANQLFWVRARLAILETRLERIRQVERSAADSEPPASVDSNPLSILLPLFALA
jgi:hypothetical protein